MDHETAGRNRVLRASRGWAARGFSLVELVTALGVAAVVAAVSLPQLSAYAAQYRLSSGANQLAVDLARARMKAVGENRYVRVQFGTQSFGSVAQGSVYRLSTSSDGVNFTQDGPAVSLPRGVAFYAFPQQVDFNRQGLANTPVTLWTYNDAYQWRVISMNSIGRVTVQ
ncbi:MAG: hypothetical protein KatS3mg077_2336 [Candidatus Binatia bacterium]|nr:MAG: hypothetical protein KatS3mg077_2336 [Candidatus Binatia bacterium]